MASYAGNPRITIDSEADWTRIKDNFTSALLAQIDAKLDPNEDDESREKLREELVRRCMQWKDQLFDLAVPNLRLNGRPYDEYLSAPEPTEDFDEALDRRIRSLAAERELIQVQIAERRSKTPLAIHGLMDDLVKRKVAAEYVPTPTLGEDGEDLDEEGLGGEREELERKEEMETTLEETLEILEELERSLPVQLERANRARNVAQEIASSLPS